MKPIRVTCDVKLYIPLENLHESQGELKSLSRESFEKLWNEILTEGICAPLFVWKDDGKWKILDGHQRTRLLRKKQSEGHKIPDIPCVEIIAKTKAEAARKLLAYVSQYGKVDKQGLYEFIELNEIDHHELVDRYDLPDLDIDSFISEYYTPLEEHGDGSEDNVPDIKDNELGVKLGDIYQLGEHRLMCGDATNKNSVIKLIDGCENIDLIYTDPPYGMNAVSKSGVLSKNYKKDIIGDDNNDVAKKSFRLIFNMFKHCHHVWWGANYYSSVLPDSESWFVWDKNNGESDQTDCELAFANFRSVNRMFKQASEKTNRVHRVLCYGLQPTQKPVSLFDACVEKFKIKPKNVLDVFGGSGSTLIACEKSSITCYSMELDPHYCSVIIKRWEDYTGKKAKKLNE